jgi:hypothetical protein
MVQKAIQKAAELKFTTVSSSTTYSNTGALVQLSGMAQGNTDTSRNGDRVKPSRVRVKGTMLLADTTNVVTYCLFWFRPEATPSMTQVFEDLATSLSPLSTSPQHDFRQDVVVLKKETFFLDAYHPMRKFEIDLNLNTMPVMTFIAGSATTQINGLYIAWLSDSGATTHPTVTFWSKFEFTDI